MTARYNITEHFIGSLFGPGDGKTTVFGVIVTPDNKLLGTYNYQIDGDKYSFIASNIFTEDNRVHGHKNFLVPNNTKEEFDIAKKEFHKHCEDKLGPQAPYPVRTYDIT